MGRGSSRDSSDTRASTAGRTTPQWRWTHTSELQLVDCRRATPSDASNGYTADEREAANRDATLDRIRLGAAGSRFAAGADLGLLPSLRIGLQWALDWQRTLFKGSDPTAITQWVTAEGALLLELHWPAREAPEASPAADSDDDVPPAR